MATGDLIYADSFQHAMQDSAGVPPGWTLGSGLSTSIVDGVTPMLGRDQCWQCGGSAGSGYAWRSLGANFASVTVDFYYRTGALANDLIMALDDAGTLQCELRQLSTGELRITRNGTVLATSTNTLTTNNPYHIQVLLTVHNSAGTYEVKVDGTSTGWIPAATGQNTRNGSNDYANRLRMYAASFTALATGHRFAYLHVREGLSSSLPALVHVARPSGDGTDADWVGNYAAEWYNVGERWANDDQTFNQSGTDTHKSSHVLQGTPSGTIYGVQASLLARQDAGSGHTIRAYLLIGGTRYYGAAQALGATWARLVWVWPTNPDTSSAWVTADLAPGAIELGYERVS